MANDFPHISVKNISVHGLRISNLKRLLHKEITDGNTYDLVIFEIGSNDIIRGVSAKRALPDMEQICKMAKELSPRVIYFSGNVGATPIWPRVLQLYYERLTERSRSALSPLLKKYDISHVDVFSPCRKDPLLSDRNTYFAPDRFHPNDAGYRIWYASLKNCLDTRIRLRELG